MCLSFATFYSSNILAVQHFSFFATILVFINLVSSSIILPVAAMVNQYHFTFCFHEEISKSFPIEHILFKNSLYYIEWLNSCVTHFINFVFSKSLPLLVLKLRFLFLFFFFLNFADLYVILDGPGIALPTQSQMSARFTRNMLFETYETGLKFSFRFEQKLFMNAQNIPFYVLFGLQGRFYFGSVNH